MSTLLGKRILIVGETDSQAKHIEEALDVRGMHIHKMECADVTVDKLKNLHIDLVLINHLHDDVVCKASLATFQSKELDSPTPVFILVQETSEEIQEALSLGAADYITPEETADSIAGKMQSILSENDGFPSASMLDISPPKLATTEKGIKVYIVEDDPLLRTLLSSKLQKSEFPYEFSNTGENVIDSMLQFKPEVIVLDLMLPGKNGLEVLREIKQNQKLTEVPVIVFSNKDEQADKNAAQKLGADKFFVKAMTDLAELVAVIEELAHTRRAK